MTELNEDTNDKLEDNLFFFESDHLALRGNKDYSDVLKNLLILLAQRTKSIENYNKVIQLKKEALAHPNLIVEKLMKGEPLGVPDFCNIPKLPIIDWSKYNNIQIPESSLKQIYSSENEKQKPKESPEKNNEKHWSAEEQKRLEELLQMYPPEPIELHRYKKIANALGNRTILQVQSRVQKYFQRLYSAGLPVPGRIPKNAEKRRRAAAHKHQRHNHYLWKPTTFFPDLCVPVVMSELDEAPGPSAQYNLGSSDQNKGNGSNYLSSTKYHEGDKVCEKTENELQLQLLKRARKIKIKEENDSKEFQIHLGYKCDFCNEEPIHGTRWHCINCISDSVDFCTDCVIAQLHSEKRHDLYHNLICYDNHDFATNSDSEAEELINNKQLSDDSSESDEDNTLTLKEEPGNNYSNNLNYK